MGNNTYIAPVVQGTEELMSSDIATLADDTVNVGTVLPDNTSNRYLFAIFELELASVDLSAQANPAVELYLVPSYSGTDYADTGTDASSSEYPPAQYLAAVLGVAATNAAHRAVSPHIMLDPIKYTPVIINKTGAAFVSANSLKSKYYTMTTA